MNEQPLIKPGNLYEYLNLIRVKVSLYIGTDSLYSLAAHIAGFEAAVWVLGENKNIGEGFNRFHNFVATQYDLTSSGEGWPGIILKKTNHNDQEAIKEFYRLFDLYTKDFPL